MTMKFDLNKYATVAERLTQFHIDHPDGRIVTEWANDERWDVDERKHPKTWVIKATIYLTAGDQANKIPKATGHAFEIDGTGGANNTSALENAESSAIGRALMVMGYSMNKDPNTLASREEMQKVAAATDWLAEADKVLNIDDLRSLYTRAKAANAPAEVLERLKDYGAALTDSKDSGVGAGGARSGKSGAK
jgi:hypothetical protein